MQLVRTRKTLKLFTKKVKQRAINIFQSTDYICLVKIFERNENWKLVLKEFRIHGRSNHVEYVFMDLPVEQNYEIDTLS